MTQIKDLICSFDWLYYVIIIRDHRTLNNSNTILYMVPQLVLILWPERFVLPLPEASCHQRLPLDKFNGKFQYYSSMLLPPFQLLASILAPKLLLNHHQPPQTLATHSNCCRSLPHWYSSAAAQLLNASSLQVWPNGLPP